MPDILERLQFIVVAIIVACSLSSCMVWCSVLKCSVLEATYEIGRAAWEQENLHPAVRTMTE